MTSLHGKSAASSTVLKRGLNELYCCTPHYHLQLVLFRGDVFGYLKDWDCEGCLAGSVS